MQLLKARPPTPRRPTTPPPNADRRVKASVLVPGSRVEYHSTSNGCWIPTWVLRVNEETGGVEVHVKRGQEISLQEQHISLRPTEPPTRAQIQHVQSIFQRGRFEEEAEHFFNSYAVQGVMPASCIRAAGLALDALLGMSGCVLYLNEAMREVMDEQMDLDSFYGVFFQLLRKQQDDFAEAMPEFRTVRNRNDAFADVYTAKDVLGRGTFGTVFRAVAKRSGQERAVKQLTKTNYNVTAVHSEIDHLCMLDHPHIVKLYEWFDTATEVYLVMDYCEGGELTERIMEPNRTRRGPISEQWAATVMWQVLSAIHHVHSRGILHLDLKSANIMLMHPKSTLPPFRSADVSSENQDGNSDVHVMVIDLGVARLFRAGNFKNNREMGTPLTMAPEVWRGDQTPKADVFSCGVVMYQILTASFPFEATPDKKLAIAYWNTRPKPRMDTKKISEDAVMMMTGMLELDRLRRATAYQCLQTPWVRQGYTKQLEEQRPSSRAKEGAIPLEGALHLPKQLIARLEAVPERSLLHKIVTLKIARDWPSNRAPTIKRLFTYLDVLSNCNPSVVSVARGLTSLGMGQVRAEQVADAMDLSRDGSVTWTECLAACTFLDDPEFEDVLWDVFAKMDSDGDQLLTLSDIVKQLPSNHQFREEIAAKIFLELTGRAEEGAKCDYKTFQRSFFGNAYMKEQAAKTQQEMDEISIFSPGLDLSTAWDVLLTRASNFFEGRQSIF